MDLKDLQEHWTAFGKTDPLWAILSKRGKEHNWDVDEFFRTGREWIDQMMSQVDTIRPSLSRGVALDFGCGVGRLTQALCRYFAQCHGVDIASSMIDAANQFNAFGDRCRYHLNERDDLQLFGDNTFDLVYSKVVLQHMEPQYSKKYIKEFIRVLAPGGLAVFQVPAERIPVECLAQSSSRTALSGLLPSEGFRARLALPDLPASAGLAAEMVPAGRQKILTVRVRNESPIVWPALGDADGRYQIKLGSHWLSERGDLVADDDGRTLLPYDLRPGDEVELPLLVTTPNRPGRYILQVDLVQEGIAWFSDVGSPIAAYRANIGAAGESAPSLEGKGLEHAIQMHGIPRKIVADLIRACGARLLDAAEDRLAGEYWTSFTYYVTK